MTRLRAMRRSIGSRSFIDKFPPGEATAHEVGSLSIMPDAAPNPNRFDTG
jgi:hypothetical protein